jgi:hypothetical protein
VPHSFAVEAPCNLPAGCPRHRPAKGPKTFQLPCAHFQAPSRRERKTSHCLHASATLSFSFESRQPRIHEDPKCQCQLRKIRRDSCMYLGTFCNTCQSWLHSGAAKNYYLQDTPLALVMTWRPSFLRQGNSSDARLTPCSQTSARRSESRPSINQTCMSAVFA